MTDQQQPPDAPAGLGGAAEPGLPGELQDVSDRLAVIDDIATEDRPAVFEQIHRRLAAILDATAEGRAV